MSIKSEAVEVFRSINPGAYEDDCDDWQDILAEKVDAHLNVMQVSTITRMARATPPAYLRGLDIGTLPDITQVQLLGRDGYVELLDRNIVSQLLYVATAATIRLRQATG